MINQLHNAPLTNTQPNRPDRNMKYDPSRTFHIDFREWVLCYLQNGCGEFVGFEVLRGGVFEVGGFVLSLALGFVDSSIGGLEVCAEVPGNFGVVSLRASVLTLAASRGMLWRRWLASWGWIGETSRGNNGRSGAARAVGGAWELAAG
jgi:hypothetical protein